jgi:hypothetical protein
MIMQLFIVKAPTKDSSSLGDNIPKGNARGPMVALFSEELNSWDVHSQTREPFYMDAATPGHVRVSPTIRTTIQKPAAYREEEQRSSYPSTHVQAQANDSPQLWPVPPFRLGWGRLRRDEDQTKREPSTEDEDECPFCGDNFSSETSLEVSTQR